MVLLATLVCQLRKQLLTLWIFFRDLLNNETQHKIVAGQNTVSLIKVRTLAHAQTNVVHSSCQPSPTSSPLASMGPGSTHLSSFMVTNHRMQHSVHPSSALLPSQAILRTVSLRCLLNEQSMMVVLVRFVSRFVLTHCCQLG